MNRRGSSAEAKYLKLSASDIYGQEMQQKGFLTDMALLKGMVRQLRVMGPKVVLCRHQSRLLMRRLSVIYETLNKLPKPTPSPQLFSVFQCSLFLLSKLCPPPSSAATLAEGGSIPLWQHVLKERYVCTIFFGSIRSRIRQVWRLQHTDQWEGEDKEAAAKDEEDAMERIKEMIQQQANIEDGGRREECFEEEEQKEAEGGDVSLDGIRHLMRRFDGVSSWKLLFNEHITLNRVAVPRGAMGDHRFEVYLGATLHKKVGGSSPGVPPGFLDVNRSVVVKVLPASSPCMSPFTMECFVIDVATRMQWVHPHLVEVFGGFAERLMKGPKAELTPLSAPQNTDTAGVPPSSVPPPSCSVEEGEYAEPYLGLVVEELATASVVGMAESHEPIGSASSFPTAWCRTARLFSALDELSYPFSVREAVEVVSQAADALQYCLLDGGDVPGAVRRSWASITPSNVYVRELPIGEADNDNQSQLSELVGQLTDRFEVRILPRLFAEGRPLSRWDPAPSHPCPETYCLSLLLLLLTEGSKPYDSCLSHLDIERSIADPTMSPLPNPETLLLQPGGGLDQSTGMTFATAAPELASAMRKAVLWGTKYAEGFEEGHQGRVLPLALLRQLLRDTFNDLRRRDTESVDDDAVVFDHSFRDGGGHMQHPPTTVTSPHDEYGIAGAVISGVAVGEPSHVGAA